MTDDLPGDIAKRDPQIPHRAQIDQGLFIRKELLDADGVITGFSGEHSLAWCFRNLVGNILSEPVAHPEGERSRLELDAFATLGHEGVAHVERFGEMPDQRREE